MGALAAIYMCMVLIYRKREEEGGKLFMVAMGFLSMGLLDGFHAICAPGQAFVFLHSIAGLAGGLGFVFVWSPGLGRYALGKKWIPRAVGGGAVLIGIWALSLPGTLPEMVHNGEFTTLAILINFLAGGLFLAAALRFILDFYLSGKKEVYMFAVLALLFGLSGILFKYSVLWDDEWWLWHLLRLIAYLFVLGFMVKNYYQIQQELSKHHEHLQGLVDKRTMELKETNENLDLKIAESKKAEQEITEKSIELEKQFEKSEKQRIAGLVVLNDLNKTTMSLKAEITERKKAEEARKKLLYDV
ncbi:hypothetical protein KA005_22010, partial [bacterium]|nr:hypothetical protein [bacterium]